MNDGKDTTANRKGRELIKQYEHAVAHRKQAELQVSEARASESSATAALAKWLAPADAKAGETFGIWERDTGEREVLYRVSFTSVSGPTIEKRYR